MDEELLEAENDRLRGQVNDLLDLINAMLIMQETVRPWTEIEVNNKIEKIFKNWGR